MKRLTRRRLLTTGAAGLTVALSGCSDGSEASEAPSNGGGSTPTPTPTANATTTTAGPELRYPDFTARTIRITDGIVWHATRWEPTMRDLRNLALRVRGTVEDLQGAGGVTENDIAELERQTTALAEFLRENVVSHYAVDDPLLNGNNVYVQQLKIAARRGDSGGQSRQLQRLYDLYRNYTQGSVIEQAFPNGPIHAKLYDDLATDGAGTVFGLFHPASDFVVAANAGGGDDDGDPQHSHEFQSGHAVVAHSHAHPDAHNLGEHHNEPADRRLYAYRNGQFDILQDTNLDEVGFEHFEPELTNVFGPVSLPERREAAVYVTVNRPTEAFTSLPLQIQRFDSPSTATEAVEFLRSAGVFEEGTEEVAGRSWRRVYYSQQGTNIYAFLLRTGACVTTLFPEGVPWGERVDWPGPFEGTWIGENSGDGGDD